PASAGFVSQRRPFRRREASGTTPSNGGADRGEAGAGFEDFAGQLTPGQVLRKAGAIDQPFEADAGLDAHLVEQIYEVLGGDVAGRARRIGAAAQPACSAIRTTSSKPRRLSAIAIFTFARLGDSLAETKTAS